jgi:hypothetical protein
MGRTKNICKLCKVKKKSWEEGIFFGVNCKKHFVPLIVLKEHRKKITEDEYKIVETLVAKDFSTYRLNNKLNDSEDHWHIHLKRR